MIIVNPNTRQFNIPGADLVFGVTDDSGAEIKHFQCPRYVGNNVDVASSFVRINYRNANGETDFYLVNDLSIDGDNVTFSWSLTSKVTDYKGQVKFVMCVVGPDLKVKWHTTLGTGQVLEGLEPDNSHVEDETADVVAALIAMVEAQTTAVEAVGAEQIALVNSAAKNASTDAVAEIEAKRANSLASIPEDYTTLSTAVEKLARGKAPGIVCEVDGSAVTVSDASDMAIQGLKIFGRSTQNGVPTPDNPVEIVSVESPTVVVAGKNLIPPSTGTISAQGITSAPTSNGTVLLSGTATQEISRVVSQNFLLPAGEYTLSVAGIHTVDGNKDRVYLNAADGSGTIVNYVMIDKPVTFEMPSSAVVRAAIVFAPGSTYANEVAHIQLEAGDTATTIELHKPFQTAEAAHPLRGIPVDSGGNYTDENGQRWVCDEIDFERGVYIQRIDTAIFTEADILSTQANTIRLRKDVSSINQSSGLCNVTNNYVYNATLDAVHFYVTGSNCWVFVPIGYDLKAKPVELVYQRTVPAETPLSESELAAYRTLHTNKPNTTILNDSNAFMSVEYVADTKLYIDQKIMEALQ